jgi:predicted PurR-regulated permease PerM
MGPVSAIAIRQILLMLLIALIFSMLFWQLAFFVPAFLGAYTLYVLLRGPLFYLTERRHWNNKLATAALLTASFLLLVLLFNGLFEILGTRIASLFQNSERLLENSTSVIKTIEARYGVSLLTPENIKSMSDWVVHEVQVVIGATVSGLGLLLVMFFILWFMLTEGKRMEQTFFDWMPLRHENVAYVRKYLHDLVWGNALGIPLMGAVQGLTGLIAYLLLGIEDPWLWFAITFVSGMLPVLGVALAYVPLSLLLLAQGQEGKALFIFLFGLIVLGSIDNIARMWLMKKINQTHPLITLFGVIAGLQLFGFIGFVFGPILISLFILLLQIYHKEFSRVV